MARSWFRPWGWIFLPVAWQGVLVTLGALAFSLQIFLFVDAHSHSVSDTLYGVFAYLVPCWILVYWVATKTAETRPKGTDA